MSKWEELFFTLAITVFGWLLFRGNQTAAAPATSSALPYSDASDIPWLYTFNQTAGTVGPLPATQDAAPANYLPVNVTAVGQANQTACTTCSIFPWSNN